MFRNLAARGPYEMIFEDRADAGRRLAEELRGRALENPIVLGLPRGGVEVAHEIARVLHAPLDVIPARKLGAPFQPELAIGAIAPGAAVLNDSIVAQLGISQREISEVVEAEVREMERRASLFRSGRPPLDVTGRTAIVVDDGLATGATAAAAIESVRRSHPLAIILAVPIGARETVERLRPVVDELVCLATPADFQAVGQWYRNFDQTSDQRVMQLLRESHEPLP